MSDSLLFCTIWDYCLWPWCFCCCYEGTFILFDCSPCEAAKMNQIILNEDEFTERLYGCESSCDICVCMNSISLIFRTLWENRNEYCVSFSWSSCSNLSSSLCLVSICPLPANLPQEWWQARAWHKSAREGRLFIFDFINNLLLWIYNTTKDDTASSYESAVRNTTRNCKIKKRRGRADGLIKPFWKEVTCGHGITHNKCDTSPEAQDCTQVIKSAWTLCMSLRCRQAC